MRKSKPMESLEVGERERSAQGPAILVIPGKAPDMRMKKPSWTSNPAEPLR